MYRIIKSFLIILIFSGVCYSAIEYYNYKQIQSIPIQQVNKISNNITKRSPEVEFVMSQFYNIFDICYNACREGLSYEDATSALSDSIDDYSQKSSFFTSMDDATKEAYIREQYKFDVNICRIPYQLVYTGKLNDSNYNQVKNAIGLKFEQGL